MLNGEAFRMWHVQGDEIKVLIALLLVFLIWKYYLSPRQCIRCNGTGKVNGAICYSCKGKGRV